MSNLQAVLTSAAMAAPKKGGFHLVSDYRAVNKKIEKVSGITPIQEVEMADLRSKTRKLDMLQGYLADVVGGRSPVHVHHRHPRRSVSPTRAPQRVLNATAYFQGAKIDLLTGLNCKVWLDGITW